MRLLLPSVAMRMLARACRFSPTLALANLVTRLLSADCRGLASFLTITYSQPPASLNFLGLKYQN